MASKAKDESVKVDGQTIRFIPPDKVLYEAIGTSKADVLEYLYGRRGPAHDVRRQPARHPQALARARRTLGGRRRPQLARSGDRCCPAGHARHDGPSPVSGRIPAAVAGTAGGFLNTAVGVAAPAMLVYAQATGWKQRSSAATLQPIVFTMGATSVVTKVGLGAAPMSGLPPLIVIVLVLAMAPVGIFLGGRVARRVPSEVGRRVAVVVVAVGALTLLGRGSGALRGCSRR